MGQKIKDVTAAVIRFFLGGPPPAVIAEQLGVPQFNKFCIAK